MNQFNWILIRKKRKLRNFRLGFLLLLSLCTIIALTDPVKPVYAQSVPGPEAGQSSDDNLDEPQEQPNDAYYSPLFAYSWQIPEEEASTNTFWIEVNLSQQMLYAYRGDQIINTFLISSGGAVLLLRHPP